jgi:hypothetical protein
LPRPERGTLGEKIGRSKEKGGQGSEVWIKTGAVMSGDSMTANHVEHGIATFPGSPGRGGRRRRHIDELVSLLGRHPISS